MLINLAKYEEKLLIIDNYFVLGFVLWVIILLEGEIFLGFLDLD